jgi:hypothetical protein
MNLDENTMYSVDRKESLVEVIAYCLMPNHFHIVLRELKEGARTEFLRKLCVGYANYYNFKYKHSGTIFQGKYKSKKIDDEEYLQIAINYVHFNPYKLKEPNISNELHIDPEYIRNASEYCKNYEYSSYKDYLGEIRPEKAILAISDIAKESPNTAISPNPAISDIAELAENATISPATLPTFLTTPLLLDHPEHLLPK